VRKFFKKKQRGQDNLSPGQFQRNHGILVGSTIQRAPIRVNETGSARGRFTGDF
jgi:hypothetical protein